VDYLSGNGSPEGSFDTLYGTPHDFYGKMDLFTLIPERALNLGLVDMGTTVEATPLPWLHVTSELHRFVNSTRGRGESATGSTLLGHEADLELRFVVMEGAQFELMGGVFVPGDAMRPAFLLPSDQALVPELRGHAMLDVAF
jgi:hypothetical protein